MWRDKRLASLLLASFLLLISPKAMFAAIESESEAEPQEAAAEMPDRSGIQFLHDVEYGRPNGHPLHVEIAIPDARVPRPLPAVLFFHPGGFVEGTHKQSPIALLAKHGFFAASVEYRFSNEAPFPAQLQDGQLAVRWLRANAAKYGVDPGRIAAWGGSAGANLSQWLGTMRHSDGFPKAGGYEDVDDSVQAVCSFFGGSDYTLPYRIGKPSKKTKNVEQLLRCTYKGNPKRYKMCSAITYVRADDPPFFLVNGTLDRVVLPEQGIEMDKALTKAGVPHEFILVRNGGHLFNAPKNGPPMVPSPNVVRQRALAFLDNAFRASKSQGASSCTGANKQAVERRKKMESPSSGDEDRTSTQAGEQRPQASADVSRPFDIVKIPSGNLTIYGALWKPPGAGPFPAMVYNHAADNKVPLVAGDRKGYGRLGPFYARKGFVFLMPLRRGHTFGYNLKDVCTSEGELLGDRVDRASGPQADQHSRNKIFLREQEVDNEDVVAAVEWLKKQSFVDPSQIVMSGISFGGIQTILASEKDQGVKAFVPFAAGAMSWAKTPELHEHLKRDILAAKAPIFLIQARNDADLGPSEFLGPVLEKKGPPNQCKIYPEFMPELGHRSGHMGFATWPAGTAIWGPDVLQFIHDALRK